MTLLFRRFSQLTLYAGWLLIAVLMVAAPVATACTPELSLSPLQDTAPDLNLPVALKGQPTFIVWGFSHKEQAGLESALEDIRGLSDVRVVEIPVVKAQWQSFQEQIEPFMRLQMKNKGLLQYVYPLYTDKGDLRTQLALGNKDDRLFSLCDSEGVEQWRSTEPWSPDSLQSFLDRFNQLSQ